MNRQDVERVLAPLRPFQRRTVDHAFHRLFEAPDSTGRFLVADEVGLGKTLVARGIIARTIEHLWEKVGRIDIVYVCSNASIARANLPKLRMGQAGEYALATRLTMLAKQLAVSSGGVSLASSRLNFVSFTPGTSFNMGNSTGWSEERRVLYALLLPLASDSSGLQNLLQGNVMDRGSWRASLAQLPALDPNIATRFRDAWRAQPGLGAELQLLFETWFRQDLPAWPADARWRRNRMIGQLRHMLAQACIHSLEPDLVILDEFQRFKHLLGSPNGERDPAADLAQVLFEARTPEGQRTRTLLLSATPYKLYTADAEIEHEDHYADFLGTTRFLMDDGSRVKALQGSLSRFGAALKRATAGGEDQVLPAKVEVERALRGVMARTERVSASEDRDAMVEEPSVQTRLEVSDVRQYLAADALFRAVGDQDPMLYWKSAPYLSHFMHSYRFNERLDETVARSPEKVAEVLRAHGPAFLSTETLLAWGEVAPANAKLRELVADLLDGGLWRLLWMPPTLPYWPLDAAYAGMEGRTKSLLFSAWNVVPDVVSAVLSYEAERRMVGGQIGSYQDPATQQVPLLRLTQTAAGSRSRHRLLLLLLPCLPLADLCHPLDAPPDLDRRAWVRTRVEALLGALPNPLDQEVDDRWEWAAPMLLDPGLRDFLRAWRDDAEAPRPNKEAFGAYIEDLLHLPNLGRQPEGLAALLTEVALGSPAVLAARTLASAGIPDHIRRAQAVQLADAFWRLFNRPAVTLLLVGLAKEAEARKEEGHYWRLVLRYSRDGNLQAVLDEAWHLAWEQQAWAGGEPSEAVAARCVQGLVQVVEPTPSRVHASFLELVGENEVRRPEDIRVRTDFALRFGDIRTEERLISQDAVRAAFNSPFRPFVLASTSVGQEGLDFHPWCHHLVHWNLPGNPVDLEQREGRVHRYKGHAVRKNVAGAHGAAALLDWRPGVDLWSLLFDHANTQARASGESDLVPHWMAPGPWRVQRCVPMLPYTREVEGFQRLKRQLAAYRVVFGQPRQQELVTLLDKAGLDTARLREWAVDLSPRTEER